MNDNDEDYSYAQEEDACDREQQKFADMDWADERGAGVR